MAKLRILLADDHEAVREGLKAILNAQDDMCVIGEAADGRAAVAQTRDLQPDLVVLDVSMPRLNGLKTMEALAHESPHVKVLTFTRHADDGYLQQLLRAGASGYVLKQSRSAELLQAIRAVARGGMYLDPTIAGRVVSDFRRRTNVPNGDEPGHTLSPREEQTLRLAAWGYSNKEIAAQLELSVKTVETHKTNAMQKLSLQSRTDIVRYALLQGWLQDL